MDQILSEEARIRLGNIAMVKPEKAERLESIILLMRSGACSKGKSARHNLSICSISSAVLKRRRRPKSKLRNTSSTRKMISISTT